MLYNREKMNILSAIYSGTNGLMKAKENMDLRAGRISQLSHSVEAQEHLAEDLVGLEIDKAQAKASANVVRVSDQILSELTQLAVSSKK